MIFINKMSFLRELDITVFYVRFYLQGEEDKNTSFLTTDVDQNKV